VHNTRRQLAKVTEFFLHWPLIYASPKDGINRNVILLASGILRRLFGLLKNLCTPGLGYSSLITQRFNVRYRYNFVFMALRAPSVPGHPHNRGFAITPTDTL
jgi:hypothetical protein